MCTRRTLAAPINHREPAGARRLSSSPLPQLDMQDVRAAGPLERHLRTWSLGAGKEAPRLIRLHQYILSNWVTMSCSLLTMIVEVADILLIGSLHAAKDHLSVVIGLYSCGYAQILFHFYREELQQWLAIVVETVARVEGVAHPASQESMARTARLGHVSRRVYVCLGFGTFCSLLYNLYGARLLWGEHAVARALRWAVILAELVATSSCLNSFYYMIPMILTMHSASADLHDATGRSLESGPCLPWCASVQSAVLRACLVADSVLCNALPHILLGIAGVPLIATVEVITSGGLYDIYAVTTAPIIMTLFVPLCLVGERLGEARRGVAVRAARGPWLLESLPQRRLRLHVMSAAGGAGAPLRASGVGVLDKPACLTALKSWFSFIQLLLNTVN